MFIKFGTTRVRLNHISVISDPFNAGENFGSYCHSVRSACSPARKSLHASIPKAAPSSCMQRYLLHWKVERKTHSAATRVMPHARCMAPTTAAGHAGLQGARGKAD